MRTGRCCCLVPPAGLARAGAGYRGAEGAAQRQGGRQPAADPSAASRLRTLVAGNGGSRPTGASVGPVGPVGPVGRGAAEAAEEIQGLVARAVCPSVRGAGLGGRRRNDAGPLTDRWRREMSRSSRGDACSWSMMSSLRVRRSRRRRRRFGRQGRVAYTSPLSVIQKAKPAKAHSDLVVRHVTIF